MKILAIETSTMLGGAAVIDEEKGLISEIRLNVKTTHSERLMTAIDTILRQSDLTLDEVDAFAAAAGPGSFTGLRIGLGTVKGLSYATGKPVVTVPTLEAFALNFTCSAYPVCLMLDARKSEVYTAVFNWSENGFLKIFGECSVKPEELVKEFGETVLFAGEGAALYEDLIRKAMGDSALFAPREKMVPSPANVAALGLEKALRGEYTNAAEALPLYIRRSEAEVKWLQKR